MSDLQPLSNREATLLRKLQSSKYRKKEQLFMAEGERGVLQIIQNGVIAIKKIFLVEESRLWDDPDWSVFLSEYPCAVLTSQQLAEFSDTDNPQDVLALCRVPSMADLETLNRRNGLIIACDAIQNPGNLGTIVRTGSWFGADGLICGKGTVDLFHPKVVRSTAGATGVLPWYAAGLPEIINLLEKQGWKTFLLDARAGARLLTDIHPPAQSIVVVGNEARGINQDLITADRISVTIAGQPAPVRSVESLNAAVSFGIAMHHFSPVAGT